MNDENKPVDPNHIIHLSENFKRDTEEEMKKFANPVDFIMAERKKHQVEVSGPAGMSSTSSPPPPQPEQSKVPMVAIDGHVLPGDTVTLMLYSLVTLAKKDKKLAKVLRSFKYTMKDVNGEIVWK